MKRFFCEIWRERWNISGAALFLIGIYTGASEEQWAEGCFYLIMARMSYDIHIEK